MFHCQGPLLGPSHVRASLQMSKALLAQGDNANAVTIGALDDFEERLSKVKKRSTAITLKDVIAAQKPVDEPLTLNL